MASMISMGSLRNRPVTIRSVPRSSVPQRRPSSLRSCARFFVFVLLLFTMAGLSTMDVLIRRVVRHMFSSPSPVLAPPSSLSSSPSVVRLSVPAPLQARNRSAAIAFRVGDHEGMGKREISLSDASLEDVLQQRIKKAVQSVHETEKNQPFLLHILLLGGCEKESLRKIVDSLQLASYVNDLVHLTIAVNCTSILPYAKDIKWEHGTKRLIESGGGIDDVDPLRLWWPESDREYLLLLPSNARISPGFYKALRTPILDSLSETHENDGDVKGAHRSILVNTKLEKGKNGSQNGESEGKALTFGLNSLFGISLDAQSTPLLNNGVAGGVAGGARPPRLGSKGAPADKPYLTQVIAKGCQMLFPKPWREFWEWHQMAQAPQISTPESKFDEEAYDFSSTCRQDWQASFLTFAIERDLFNLYYGIMRGGKKFCFVNPEQDPLQVLSANPLVTAGDAVNIARRVGPIKRLDSLPRFDYCGRKITPGFVVSDSSQLKELLAPISREGAVVGVMVSPGYDDMLHNWLCYVKELAVRNYFIITQDREQAERLGLRGLAVYYAGALLQEEGQEKPLDYGSIPYKKFILARTKAIGEILHAGYNVLLADVDAIWLSDPFLHLKEENVDMFAQLEERGNPCGGFLYLIHTIRVLEVWDLIIAMFSEHIAWLETHSSKADPVKYEKFLHSQQHNHEQKYLQDMLKQGRHPITLRGLDPLLFINGRDYFDHKLAQMKGIVPVMIHNNYIVGKPSKVHRFHIKGMWRVDASGTSCKCLTLSCQDHPAPWSNANITLPESERRKRSVWLNKLTASKEKMSLKARSAIEKGLSSVKELVTRKSAVQRSPKLEPLVATKEKEKGNEKEVEGGSDGRDKGEGKRGSPKLVGKNRVPINPEHINSSANSTADQREGRKGPKVGKAVARTRRRQH